MPIPVGIYARISEDTEGAGKGVGRQLEDCRGLAELRRWRPIDYEDNDLSAYQRGVVRPAFERMLEDLRVGIIKGVVVYNLDRFARQPRDLERAIDIFEDHPTYVFATLEGDINLSTIDGRTLARVMVAFANKSSADTGRRVKRKQLELASEGKPHGGRQPYGWKDDGVTVDPEAKEIIRKAHQRILAGARISTVRDDWARQGIAPTSRAGKRFRGADSLHHKTVRRVLTNPALAGIKIYNGEIVTDAEGRPVKAAWDPICTEAELAAVTAELDSRTVKGPKASNAMRYLLSGIARCGVCGASLRGQTRKRASGSRYAVYMCDKAGYTGGCGKIARQAAPIDALITRLILSDQARRRFQPEEIPGWSGAARLRKVSDEIAQLVTAKKAGAISVSTLIQLMPELERERDRLTIEKRQAQAAARQAELADLDTDEAFDALPLERQRALILRSLQAVIVHPQGKGVAKFDPDLIEPVWA